MTLHDYNCILHIFYGDEFYCFHLTILLENSWIVSQIIVGVLLLNFIKSST